MSDLPALREPSVVSRTVPVRLARYRVRAYPLGREFALGGTSARLAALVGASLLLAVVLAAFALTLLR